MGRPPSNGGPSFRFTQPEIAEMESILQAHKTAMPERQVLVNLSERFSNSEERKGKIEVQMKQVWNWFQNRRYAIRAKAAKYPGKLNITQMPRDDSAAMVKGVPQPQAAAASSATVRSFPQPPQQPTVPSAAVRTFPQAPPHPAFSVQNAGRVTDNSQMEYEAKSARDGAWYDVSTFLSHRSLETGDPEVMVRFAGFGAEEDEWVNVRKNVRQRSLPCEASECVAVLPADLILCFQEGKEQALYFDAHVLDAQRRRHDVRGCRCRFLVRYDHDQSEEIVALRKICRRPETDYRLQQLHAVNESLSVNQNKIGANNNIHTVSTLRVYPPAEVQPKQNSVVPPPPAESPQKRQRLDSTVPPEGPQSQFKVESVVLSDVQQNQQRVQPAVLTPSAQPLVEPPKLDSVVPSPSTQASAELKNVVPMVVTRSDEVPLELQKVQPVMLDPSTEVSVDTHKVEIVIPSSGEATQELPTVTNVVVPLPKEEHHKTEPVPSGEILQGPQAVGPTIPLSAEVTVEAPVELHEREAVVAEPQKEPVISVSSVEVPAELHGVQPAVPDEPHTTTTEESVVRVSTSKVEEAIDTKTEKPVPTDDSNVAEEAATETKTEEPVVSANDPNMLKESAETKTEEPVVPSNDPSVVEETKTEEPVVPVNDHNMIEAEIEKPHLSDTMENNKDNHAKVAENVSDNKVENSDLGPENTAVAMEEG